MAGIGADIAEVTAELGDTVTILRTPTNIVEKMTFEENSWSTNSFAREFLCSVCFLYTTAIVHGDVLTCKDNSYLVINKKESTFEDEIVEYIGSLLKCNVTSGIFLRPTVSVNSTTFVTTKGWTTIKSSACCLIYKNARDIIKDPEETLGKDTTFTLDCFVPASYGIIAQDRLYISSTKYFRVENVESYQFTGVDVLSLVEDVREAYTP